MNLILRNFLFVFLLFSAFGVSAQIQTTVIDMETIWNTDVNHNFTSSPIPPSLHVAPNNGSVTITSTGSFTYELTYTPDTDTYGNDYFEVFYFNVTLKKYAFEIKVLLASVVANEDYASTLENTPVQIEVLENDNSSNNVLKLSATPATNNGWVEFDANGSTITFHPAPDFVGLTNFNYVVCDGLGTCDNGTVSVTVMGIEPVVHDTLTIFTKIEQPQVVLIPHSYSRTSGPANGILDEGSMNPYVYTPDMDFFGDDQIEFEHDGQFTTVIIKVLNARNNLFLFNDEYFTTTSESIEFNVLDNDLYGGQTGCVSIGSAEHGTVTAGPNKGDVIYTPDSSFEGVDRFSYFGHEGATCGSFEETATVFIHISNFAPARDQFFMSTPKRTPLLIGYDLPVSSYQFSIVEPGATLGEIIYLEGEADTTIYGKQISGYNLLIYIPYEEIEEGHDQFQIEYCALNVEGECTVSKIVKIEMDILNEGSGEEPLCFKDCVWAGDTNFDGMVDMKDLLPIGISMGDIGSPRAEANITSWYGQYAEDWNGPFNDPVIDLKHIDADGDSIVTALDTMAIHNFYGRTHALVPEILPFFEHEILFPQEEGDIYADPGDLIQLQMVLGTEENPALDVYGFAFPFAYSPVGIDAASVKINFTNTSWLSYNSPILHMSKNNLENSLDAGYTRTSGVSASGFGLIGMVEFVVIEDIEGFRLGRIAKEIEVGGGTSTVMNGSGQQFGMKIGTVTIHIRTEEEASDQNKLNPDLLKIGPNPANNFVNLHLNGSQQFSKVMVRNVTGQTVINLENIETNRTQLNVSNFQTGLYFISVFTKEGIITKKFEVIR